MFDKKLIIKELKRIKKSANETKRIVSQIMESFDDETKAETQGEAISTL